MEPIDLRDSWGMRRLYRIFSLNSKLRLFHASTCLASNGTRAEPRTPLSTAVRVVLDLSVGDDRFRPHLFVMERLIPARESLSDLARNRPVHSCGRSRRVSAKWAIALSASRETPSILQMWSIYREVL